MVQSTQDRAKELLSQLCTHQAHVTRLKRIKHLLDAAAAGKRIQYLVAASNMGPAKWVSSLELTFSDPPEQYRVGPEVRKTKRFWWNSTVAPKSNPVMTMVTEEDQKREPRENWLGFIAWVDAEWQEHEVPEIAP